MKKIIIFLSAVVLIFTGCKKEELKETNLDNVIKYMQQVEKIINGNTLSKEGYEIKLKELDKNTVSELDNLLDSILANIKEIQQFKKYNKDEYEAIHYNAKLEILALLANSEESIENKAYYFVEMVKLYTKPLVSLYDNNENIYDYLKNYKEPYCSYEECSKEYQKQMNFLYNVENTWKNIETNDHNILIGSQMLSDTGANYFTFNSNASFYHSKPPFIEWDNILRKENSFNENQEKFLHELYKYKTVKSLKSVYLAKIYMQFYLLDKSYDGVNININELNGISDEYYEESTLFVSGCTNPRYLFKNTLNKCVEFVISAQTKEDAFSYLEDENIKDYAMIDDKLCAKREGSQYKFYDNDNKLCKVLQEKISSSTNIDTNMETAKATDIDKLVYYIDEIRPYMDNVTKQAQELKAQGENLDSLLFVDGMVVNKLLDEAVQHIYEVERIKKYNGELYKQIKNIAKQDLASYIFFTSKNDSKIIAENFIGAVKIYTNEIYNLYASDIDAVEYISNYAQSDKMYEEMQQYSLYEVFNNAKSMLKQYGLSKEDENVVKDIYKFMTNALVYYGLLYKQMEDEYKQVWDNIILLSNVNENGTNIINKFLYYKMAKIIKSLYVSKISAELFLSESAYLNKAEQIVENNAENKKYLKELIANQSKMLTEACKHTRFLSANRQKECIDTINSKPNDEAFAFLEDSNAKGFVIIDDMICAKSENNQYKFYDNDNKLCKVLQEKLNQ